jgi:hypothetical protein
MAKIRVRGAKDARNMIHNTKKKLCWRSCVAGKGAGLWEWCGRPERHCGGDAIDNKINSLN